jgi:hypothetical protein
MMIIFATPSVRDACGGAFVHQPVLAEAIEPEGSG